MNRAYVSLGSNIDPERNLRAAVAELARLGRIVRVSSVWQTPPAGDPHQADFLNAAVLLETALSAQELCREVLPAIEQRLGRVRDPANRNAPRTIDLDLSLFNDETLQIDHRRLPDPDLLTRAFVAAPLAELDPACVHPQTGQTLADIAARVVAAGPAMTPRPDIGLAAAARSRVAGAGRITPDAAGGPGTASG